MTPEGFLLYSPARNYPKAVMNLFLDRKFSDYINACEDELKGEFNPYHASTILCNIASAEYELEMYRKCIKTCQGVLEIKSNCLRAHFIHLKALVKLGKDSQCQEICGRILSGPSNSYISEDISIVLEIRNLQEFVGLRLSRILDNMSSVDYGTPNLSESSTPNGTNEAMPSVTLSSAATAANNCNSQEKILGNKITATPNNEVTTCSIKNCELSEIGGEVLQKQTVDIKIKNQLESDLMKPIPSTIISAPPEMEISGGKGTGMQKKKNRKLQNKSSDIAVTDISSSLSTHPLMDGNKEAENSDLSVKSSPSSKQLVTTFPNESICETGNGHGADVKYFNGNNNSSRIKDEVVISSSNKKVKIDCTEQNQSNDLPSQFQAKPQSSSSLQNLDSMANTKKNRKATKDSNNTLCVSTTTPPTSETRMNRAFLENYLTSILLNEDHLVIRTLLKSVRSSLCCANGDVIVDDMIAFGYLQVNTGNLKCILL